jgi:hypothetical protein
MSRVAGRQHTVLLHSRQMYMAIEEQPRPSLFWDVTHRRLVACYRRSGTTYRVGVICCPKMSVIDYQSTMHNIAEK